MNTKDFLEKYKNNSYAIDAYYELVSKYDEINPATSEQKAINEVCKIIDNDEVGNLFIELKKNLKKRI